MKKYSKIFVALLAVALLLCLATLTLVACDGLFGGKDGTTPGGSTTPSGSTEEQDPDVQASLNFEFRQLEDGTYSVSKYLGSSSEIVIPNKYKDQAVTSIVGGVFYGNTFLQKVTIGENVTRIEGGAFYGCINLSEIIIPDSVTSIGYESFKGCEELATVTLPATAIAHVPIANIVSATITSGDIPTQAFADCENLRTVGIGAGVTSIASDAFSGCTNITKINVSSLKAWLEFENNPLLGKAKLYMNNVEVTEVKDLDGLESIPEHAFAGCTAITSVTIPDSVTNIDEGAFDGCSRIKSYIVAEANAVYQSKDGVLYKKEDKSIYLVPKAIGGAITILDGCTCIGEEAFSGYTGLSEITIPDSVQNIEYNAFRGCTKITKVNVTSLKAWCEIDFSVYDGNPLYAADNAKLYLNDVEVTGDVNIPSGTSKIGACAFYRLSGITSITIPDSMTTIYYWAFSGCKGITKVNYLGTIKGWCGIECISYYGNDYSSPLCVANNAKLYLNEEEVTGDVTIPSGTSKIGTCAFYGLTGITSVTIPDSVTSIGNWAFSKCRDLQTVNWNATNCTKAGSDYNPIFDGCTGLKTVTIGEGVQSIGDWAFYGCTGITKVNYLGTLKGWCEIEFGSYDANPLCASNYNKSGTAKLYLNDEEVTKVKDLDGLESIPAGAFYGLINLTSVIIPDSVTSIGGFTFNGCPITTATLPASAISYIPQNSLTTVTITSGKIGYYAFKNCTGLQTVTIDEGVTRISDSAFEGCTGLKTVNWNATAGSSYSYPFKECTGLTTVNIGENVQSFPSYAFSNCTGLQTVNWNATNCTKAGSDYNPIFDGCTRLTTINIGENVQSIPAYAFYDCKGLKTVTIGEGLQSIGHEAFFGCTGLTDIYYAGSATQWGNIKKGDNWDKYWINGYYFTIYTINYQLHYNSTGPENASAASNIATLPSEQTVLTDCDRLDLWAKQN